MTTGLIASALLLGGGNNDSNVGGTTTPSGFCPPRPIPAGPPGNSSASILPVEPGQEDHVGQLNVEVP